MFKILFLGIPYKVLRIFLILFVIVFVGKIIDFIRKKNQEHSEKGYEKLIDGVLQTSIIEQECKCPNCGCESGEVQDIRPYPMHHQYVYCCRNCKSVWQGYIYDMKLNKKKKQRWTIFDTFRNYLGLY